MKRWAPVLVAVALVAIACSSGSDSSSPQTVNPSESHAPVTLSMWSEWTSAAETKVFNKIFEGFQRQYPWITVDSRTGLTDNKITAAINSGEPPDSVLSFGVDNVGLWCSTGAWIDMTPYINGPDGIDMSSTFPPSALTYTSYNGNQCSFPFLTDVTGMYYNLDMFKAAGISDPPKTTDELLEDAKKLTQFNADGSIKVAGFVPWLGYNCCGNTSLSFGHMFGAKWLDDQGQPAFASDPKWAEMFTWQKKFITDVYGPDGYNKLQEFFSKLGGADSEWSSAHGFETEQVAMMMDGEWRNAFIADDGSNVNYATAPFPVADDTPELYGAGQIGGDVVGIPSNAKNPDAAWLLLKYLALDTGAEVKLATILKNVPTTFQSLKDPGLNSDEHFKTFLDIFGNEHSGFKPLTVIGDTDSSLWDSFIDKWESGGVPDLQQGLQDLATQIDNQLQLG